MDTGSDWSLEAVQALRKLADEKVPASAISMHLKRPVEAIHAKMRQLGITPVPEV